MNISNQNKKTNKNRGLYLYSIFAIIASTVMSLYYFIDEDFFSRFADEDHFSETLSALFLLIAGVILITNSLYKIKKGKRFRQEVLFILFGLMLVFAFGEEISWGQRIFDIPTPDFFLKYNAQQELSIHNLFIFHTSLYNPNSLVDVFVFIMGIMIPVLCFRSPNFRKALDKINFPIIQLSFLPIFSIGLIFGLAMVQITDHHLFAPNEIKEFIYSIGFLLYSIAVVSLNEYRGKGRKNKKSLDIPEKLKVNRDHGCVYSKKIRG